MTALMIGGNLFLLFSDVPVDGLGVLWRTPQDMSGWAIIAGSAALYGLARDRRFGSELVLNLALGWQIGLCLLISLIAPWEAGRLAVDLGVPGRVTELLPFVTWTTPLIIVFPLVVPSSPRTTFWVAMAAALTTPLGILVMVTQGMDVEPRAYVHTLVSPLIAVAVAWFGSRVVYSLGLDVTRAREMGSYRLESLIGAGGMGEVWRARHRLLARPAAVKLVKPDVLGAVDEGGRTLAIRRFEREAQATASMRSPHTIELYDFGIADDGTFYYVMELLDGYDLDTLVRKFGPVPPERAVHILLQVCDSLAEAHDNDLIHRDIKPANIFVCRYGRRVDFVKLLDFGLVKVQAEPASEDLALTADHFPGGTPAFIAPEQVDGSESVDGRSDLYAVGCVAYWLLTGQYVFEVTSVIQMFTAHLHATPVPPSRRTDQEIPAALERVVLACLEKDPDARPANADALAEALAASVGPEAWTPDRAGAWWHANHADVRRGPAPTSS